MHSRTYPVEGEAEEVREGYAPDKVNPHQPHDPEHGHNLDQPIRESETTGEESRQRKQMWDSKQYSGEDNEDGSANPQYASFSEEQDVWGSEDSSHR
jgi:hypothetical protein